jgi:hypothetical protein
MKYKVLLEKYGVIINDVSSYVNLLVRIAHIICNHPLYFICRNLVIKEMFCGERSVIVSRENVMLCHYSLELCSFRQLTFLKTKVKSSNRCYKYGIRFPG